MYNFQFENQMYQLSEELCDCIFNDETAPVNGMTFERVSKWFQFLDVDAFEIEYYEDPCEACPPKPRGKKKLVPFLETHFYMFTKASELVLTSISPGFVSGSFESMLAKGEVDQSYVVSIIVCPMCGHYLVDIEQVEM